VVRPVKTIVVSTGAESNVRTFPGRVEASNKVELAFQVSGLLGSLPVREG
jgi:multidrug efflux system membrane fusion protein